MHRNLTKSVKVRETETKQTIGFEMTSIYFIKHTKIFETVLETSPYVYFSNGSCSEPKICSSSTQILCDLICTIFTEHSCFAGLQAIRFKMKKKHFPTL